jgi:hypothetical protein
MRQAWGFILGFSIFASTQTSFAASTEQHELYGKAPYPNLIVGTITAAATPEQSKALFLEGRKRGWWARLSPDPSEFAAKIQPVSMTLPSGKSLTILMTAEEYRASPLKTGDFGRYTPHSHGYERARPNDPYWAAVGCVIVLCRASDAKCPAAYKSGIFRMSDGVQLDALGMHPVPGGTVIDTISMRPKPTTRRLPSPTAP